jgi:hypothetical protein
MADFNKLDLGSTEEFSMDSPSEIEDFLNGDTSKIEKIDPKKEEKKQTPVKKKEEEKQEDEEDVDILDALSEEDEDPEKPEKKEEKKETEESSDDDSNEFEVMSRQLYEMGIFVQGEDEDEPILATSSEEFANLFQQNAQKAAFRNLDNFLRSRGDDRMDLFEAIFVNGVDPKEYLPAYNRVQDFENLDITVEENQEKVFREYYKRAGLSDSLVEKKLQKAKDYGDLEEEVQDLHPKLVDQDKEELERQKLQKQQEEQTKKQNDLVYRQSVQKTLVDAIKTKELSGIPVTEAKAREVADYLLTPKYRLPNGETISEFDKYFLESKKPENINDRVLFALLKLNKFDFSKIEKKAITKETNELFQGLKKRTVKSKNEKVVQPDNFWDSLA